LTVAHQPGDERADDAANRSAGSSDGTLAGLMVGAAVFLSFLAYSAVQAPVPGPNEPHYLCKAKHYWNPDFCSGDFFLESSNAHLVFYQTVGWMTRWLSLEQTAWIARLIAYALLAFGWTRLVGKFTAGRMSPLWAAWVYLAAVTVGNLSGEWIVGGVEAKVFSYGFLFWALASVMESRWKTAGVFGGLSISFHPVVGCWGVIAAASAAGLLTIGRRFGITVRDNTVWRSDRTTVRGDAENPGEWLRRSAVPVLLLVVLSLPGVVPAVGLLLSGDNANAAQANRIQVFIRLGHHLDPVRFGTVAWGRYDIEAAWLGYVFLMLFWLALFLRTRRSSLEGAWREHAAKQKPPNGNVEARGLPFHAAPPPPGRSSVDDAFACFVTATALIAAVGYLAGQFRRLPDGMPHPDTALLPLRVMVLKLYPFRLFDVMLPLAAAVSVTNLLEQRATSFTAWQRPRWLSPGLFNGATFVGFLAFALLRPIPDRTPSHMPPQELEHWMATCRWVQEHLPADVVVLTPSATWTYRNSWAFKWYAQRPEYFSFKDCPQDAEGILEWNRRRKYLLQWSARHEEDGYSVSELDELRTRAGITHIIVPDPEHQLGYRVYSLHEQAFLR